MTATTPVLRVTAMTHRGAVRDHNEDALVIGPFAACGADMADPVTCKVPLSAPVLVAVADGMGGHAAGDRASAHAVRELACARPRDPDAITTVLRRIDDELMTWAAADGTGSAPPGTTVAGVVLGIDGALRFGAGDSRVYREHSGYLAQVSVDDRGPSGGLTACLGGRRNGAFRAVVEPLPGPGRFLLCSDGLSDLVDAEQMERLLSEPGGPCRSVKALWAAAMNASGRDNITIALVDAPIGAA
jgi:PPM family protein phosphatase